MELEKFKITPSSCGWAEISFGESLSANASYLMDLPIELMRSMIFSLKYCHQFYIQLDCESYNFDIISNDFTTTIIDYRKSEPFVADEYDFAYGRLKIAKEILRTLNEDFMLWVSWLPECTMWSENPLLFTFEALPRIAQMTMYYLRLSGLVRKWDRLYKRLPNIKDYKL